MTFNLDEYYPMQPTAEQSYVTFMNKNLFDHIDISRENINIPDGTLKVEEVQEKNEKLKLLLDATMEAIILFKDDLIIDCNQIAVELFNYSSKEELLNKDLKKLIFKNVINDIRTHF